jgi:uncharacterized membrane protein (UPF0182 family)
MGKQVTLKNYEIMNAISSLVELMKVKLPSKVNWNLSKNLRKLSTAIEDFYKFKDQYIKEYAVKDEKGDVKLNENNQWTIPKENIKTFNDKITELSELEDTIDILPIKLSDLDSLEVEGNIFYNLDFMIDEE